MTEIRQKSENVIYLNFEVYNKKDNPNKIIIVT